MHSVDDFNWTDLYEVDRLHYKYGSDHFGLCTISVNSALPSSFCQDQQCLYKLTNVDDFELPDVDDFVLFDYDDSPKDEIIIPMYATEDVVIPADHLG